MHRVRFLGFCVFALLASLLLAAVSTEAAQKKAKKKRPNVFAKIEDDPKLPRVLLLGDSISIGYTLPTRKLLKGIANVHRAPTNCGPTTRGLQQIDAWLGKGKWKVIHFNWGLHDLKYIAKGGRLVKPSEGKQQVQLEQYRQNLQKLVERMKRTGAKLIFATTTPVPKGAAGRVPGDAVRYNKAALEIMKEHGVAVDDLYSFAAGRLDKIQRKANVHFTPAGSRALAERVAGHVRKALEN